MRAIDRVVGASPVRTALRAASLIAGLAVTAAIAGAVTAAAVHYGGAAAPALVLAVAILPLVTLLIFLSPPVGPMAVFVTFAAGAASVPFGIVTLQVVEAATLYVALVVALGRLATGHAPLAWSAPLWWLAALVTWTVVALPSALDRTLAIRQIASLAGAIVFACVVVAVCATWVDLRRVVGAFVAVAAGMALSALVSAGQFRSFGGGSRVEGRLQGVFDQPNQLGSFCALVAPVAASIAIGGRTRRSRLLAVAALAAILGGLLLSLSRGAWIGTIMAVLYLLATLPQARRAVVALSIPLILVAAVIGSFAAGSPQLEVVGERFTTLTRQGGVYDARSEIYREAQREILADPWTGQGPGSFPVASTRASSQAFTVSAEHAHDILLTWAAESGVPAALAIVGFGVALAFTGRRAGRSALARGDPADRAIVAGLVAGLISVGGQGIVDYTFRNAVILIALFGVIGALLAAARAAPGTGARSPELA